MIQDPFLHHLKLVDARPRESTDPGSGTWMCDGCGQQRPLDRAWQVVVRNQSRAPCRREVPLCRRCVEDLHSAGRLSAEPVGAGSVAGP